MKQKTNLSLFILFMVLSFTFSSCGDNKEDTVINADPIINELTEKLIGSWLDEKEREQYTFYSNGIARWNLFTSSSTETEEYRYIIKKEQTYSREYYEITFEDCGYGSGGHLELEFITNNKIKLGSKFFYRDGEYSGNDDKPDSSTKPTVSGTKDGHDYVDLGLSVKWATCNIGAKNPEDCGVYFAWGEVSPKDNYSYKTYSYIHYTNPGFYYSNLGDICATKYDAAYRNWGSSWKMPSLKEFQELEYICTSKWTVYNGIQGLMFYAPNGNKIFFPAAGEYDDDKIVDLGLYGEYWTGTPDENKIHDKEGRNVYASVFYFDKDGSNSYGDGFRSNGLTIRPVLSDNQGGGGNGGGDNPQGDVPYIISFDFTATKSSIIVKFKATEKPTSATIKYGETTANKALSTSINGYQISATASGLKSGTTYIFKCTVGNQYGSSTSDDWYAMTNY